MYAESRIDHSRAEEALAQSQGQVLSPRGEATAGAAKMRPAVLNLWQAGGGGFEFRGSRRLWQKLLRAFYI